MSVDQRLFEVEIDTLNMGMTTDQMETSCFLKLIQKLTEFLLPLAEEANIILIIYKTTLFNGFDAEVILKR